MTKAPTFNLYCWASRQAGFSDGRIPSGSILVMDRLTREDIDQIKPHFRRALDGHTLIVPGVPETGDDQVAGIDAVSTFRARLAKVLGREVADG